MILFSVRVNNGGPGLQGAGVRRSGPITSTWDKVFDGKGKTTEPMMKIYDEVLGELLK